MNDVLNHLSRINISNEAFAQILEKITSSWHQGTSEMFSRDGRLSVYMIRSRIQEILTRFGDRRSVQHDDAYINSIPILGEEKKEEK